MSAMPKLKIKVPTNHWVPENGWLGVSKTMITPGPVRYAVLKLEQHFHDTITEFWKGSNAFASGWKQTKKGMACLGTVGTLMFEIRHREGKNNSSCYSQEFISLRTKTVEPSTPII